MTLFKALETAKNVGYKYFQEYGVTVEIQHYLDIMRQSVREVAEDKSYEGGEGYQIRDGMITGKEHRMKLLKQKP